MNDRREKILLILSFLAIHIVWGSTYLAIRFAVETVPPLLTAGLRHTIGGAALFAWCWSRGFRPTPVQWRSSLILSVFFFLFGHGSLHWAETIVPSGVAALLIATEPVWVAALMALAGYSSRLSATGVAGLAIGIGAVAILVQRPSSTSSALFVGSIVVVLSAISWTVGIVYSQKAPLHPNAIMSSAMTLLCGGVLLVAGSAVTGSLAHFSVSNVTARSALAVGYLTLFGAFTFVGYTWLLTRVSPVLVATHTYTNPIIAVVLGSLLAEEHVTPRIILSAIAVVVAILLVRRDREERATRRPIALETAVVPD
jgi:drug/metabolite transporter (DMT)-like permease